VEAVDLARRLKPAAITLDVILPEVDGWETLRQLKADAEISDIPVVMVSMLQNRELALALGAADYFTKPVDGDALVRRLTELVPLSRVRVGRLLLVDDDPDLHELVRERLASRDYALVHAMSGREGLEAAFEHLPDLVLLDLMMDEMDGFEVAARLKEDRRTQGIPIVVLTAKEMSSRDRDRLRGKIEALVEKFDMTGERLAAVIGRVLATPSRGGRHAGA
jgi:CheY-like chemotaxis protein